MSTAAVMLVKDEADIIEPVLRHLAYHVDEILVADNGSTDGTRELLAEIDLPVSIQAGDDDQVGYFQSAKTTELAQWALRLGHRWVVPCDADEVWYVCRDPNRRLSDFLAGLGRDVQLVQAALYDHVPTAQDAPDHHIVGTWCDGVEETVYGEPNPLARIGYRNVHEGALPKVACRLRPDLVIHAGNHGAETRGTGLRGAGLCVRHFSHRSSEQYVRKIRNGALAYAATDLPETTGAHWRMHGDPEAEDFEARVTEHFLTWFHSEDPEHDADLIYDPAPAMGQLNFEVDLTPDEPPEHERL